MANKIKLELTKHQLSALLNLISNVEAGHGHADDHISGNNADDSERKWIKTFDDALKANGYKRA